MSDILEVITKLTYQVGDASGLQSVIESLQKQAAAIEGLKSKLKDLQKYYDSSDNVQQQQRAQSAIDKTTQAIDRQTVSLEKRFTGNKKLQEALIEEIGLIQQLSQYITQATKEQATLTDVSQIKEYTANIKAAQAELKSLIAPLNLIGDKPDVGALAALQQRQKIIQNSIPGLPAKDVASANVELAKVKNQIKDIQALGTHPPVFLRDVGAIEAAQNRLAILKNTLLTLPRNEIAGVNQEIIKAEANLKRLQNEGIESGSGTSSGGRSTGIIGQLLGVSSAGGAGSQILKGLIRGAGIGIGFQIIPGLIAQLEEYASKLLNANDVEEKTKEGIDSVNQSLATQLSGFVSLAKALDDAFGGESAFANQVAQAKSLGTVQGEVFSAKENQFKAEQELRKKELSDLDEVNGKYTKLRDIFLKYDTGGSEQSLRSNIAGLGLDSRDSDKFNKVVDDFFKKRNELPESQRKNFKLSENDDLAKTIADQSTKANVKQSEIDNADLERLSKHKEEIYQLNKKLSERLIQLKNEELQKSVTYQSQYQDDLNNLILSNQTEQAQQLRKFDEDKEKERQQLALKGEAISARTQELYQQQRLQIVGEYSEKELQIIEQFIKRRTEAENKANDVLLSIRVNSLGSQNAVNAAGGFPNLDTILQEQEARSGMALSKLADQHEQQLSEARKFNQDTSELEQQQALEEKYLLDQLNREKFDKQLKYYDDVLNLVKEKGQRLLLEQLAQGTNQGANANRFLSGNQSAGAFRYRSIRANFKDARAQVNTEIGNTDNALTQARANQDDVVNNPDSTAEDIAKVDKAVNQLTVDKQRLNNQKAELISNEQIRQIDLAVDSFKSLSDIAVQSFNTIAQARDQDLNREISVREQRVSQATKLAEKGNVEVLNIEQKRLDAANQQKKKNALEELSINQALIVSNSILAVVKAASESGPLAPVTIIATIAALAAGFAAVKSIDTASKAEFFTGGYTGDGGKYDTAGTVHKGEFVSNQDTTRRYRPQLEAMHRGEAFIPFPQMATPQAMPVVNNGFASKVDIDRLEQAVNNVAEAVNGKTVNVSQVMNERGLMQRVEEIKSTERRRWRS